MNDLAILDNADGALTAQDASRVASAVEASTAENTGEAYGAALRRFGRWLAERSLELAALPAAEQDAAVASYAAERAETVAPATVALELAAIGRAARDAGVADPRGPLSRRALRGIRRQNARAEQPKGRGQVAGLRWRSVEASAVLAAAEGTCAGLRDAAILRLGSDALLRVSELAGVRVEDVQAETDGSGRLTLRTSKTDQEGRGETLFVGPPTMAAIRAWQDAAGVAEGPLFRRLGRGGKVHPSGAGLTVNAIRSILRRRAQAAGVEGRVSGHSLRVGSAQSLVHAGADLPALMQAGRWQDSATAAGYAKAELAGRGAVARLRYGAAGA